jgi:hypothetical protein
MSEPNTSWKRTPSAHWVPDILDRRVPYTDKPFRVQHNPYEVSLGNGHREIPHLLEIIADTQAPKAPKIKALRLLNDVLPGREAEAIRHNAFDAIRPLIREPPGGLLLHSLVCLNTLVSTTLDAAVLRPDIPTIVEILDPKSEPPLRIAAATLLRHLADLLGPVSEFTEGEIPIKIVVAAASPLTGPELIPQLFDLLARLTNVQNVRVPLIESAPLLDVLVKSIKDPKLQSKAINLAENIAMDSSHNGKLALLNAEILDELRPVLDRPEVSSRMSALGLISLLAVPKDGKERLAMASDLADALKRISDSDPDLECRRSAYKARIFVAELPLGTVVMGPVVDPSVPVRQPSSVEQEAGVKRANPKIAEKPDTMLLSPRSAAKIIQLPGGM